MSQRQLLFVAQSVPKLTSEWHNYICKVMERIGNAYGTVCVEHDPTYDGLKVLSRAWFNF